VTFEIQKEIAEPTKAILEFANDQLAPIVPTYILTAVGQVVVHRIAIWQAIYYIKDNQFYKKKRDY
jgi:hypothetical protein